MIFKKLFSVFGTALLLTFSLTYEVKSEVGSECQTVVVYGRKTNVNPKNPRNYECYGSYVDCTDVWITCDPE